MEMKFEDLITKENYFIALKELCESNKSKSALSIILHGSESETDLLISNSTVDIIQIDFPSYATYTVTFEDFTSLDNDEVYEGESFRVYKKSALMDRLKSNANLKEQETRRGKVYQHFSFACFEHQIDVVSIDLPTIRVLKSSEYINHR